MSEKDIFNATYWDKCTVQRKQGAKDSSGITRQGEYITVTGYEDLHCALSSKSISATTQTDVENQIKYTTVLFIDTDYTILPGDKILITIGDTGVVREYYAGEGPLYQSHQEIPLSRKGYA